MTPTATPTPKTTNATNLSEADAGPVTSVGANPADMPSQVAAPRFSVVIPTYNRPDLLLESIQSVVEQTNPAHEIIVVADGSAPDTVEAVRRAYPHVIVRWQENAGGAAARNHGIALASGNWIAFIDDDDLWHRDKLGRLATYIHEHSDCQAINHPLFFFATTADAPVEMIGYDRDFIAADLAECHVHAERLGMESEEAVRRQKLRVQGDSFRLYLRKDRGLPSGTVVRRDTLIRAGLFPPHDAANPDWAMFVNVARFCEWHTVPERLGFNRFHGNQAIGAAGVAPLFSLAGTAAAWYMGRPLREAASFADTISALATYGPEYRRPIQGYYWQAIRRGDLRLAYRIRQVAKLLLPRWRDYLYYQIPPQITWRFERYFLGMHRGPRRST